MRIFHFINNKLCTWAMNNLKVNKSQKTPLKNQGVFFFNIPLPTWVLG
jgi:hypothetical protein